mgnify:CR=1 FL=1
MIFQSTLPRRKWPFPKIPLPLHLGFQSTLPRRKWLAYKTIFSNFWLFQSTLPRRKWRSWLCFMWWLHNFNPHFREGSDKKRRKFDEQNIISIHTSAKEVTRERYPLWKKVYNFNPHFREGSDFLDSAFVCIHLYFNPHFREGSDSMTTIIWKIIWYFNPHFREGSDSQKVRKTETGAYFNPHFREGSDGQGVSWALRTVISIHTSAKEVTMS